MNIGENLGKKKKEDIHIFVMKKEEIDRNGDGRQQYDSCSS